MALPTSRNTTYSPGVTPVKAADLNALQDAIIGGKRASTQKVFFPFGAIQISNFTHTIGGGSDEYWLSTAAAVMYVPIIMEAGDRITRLQCNVYGDGAADGAITLLKLGTNQVQTTLASIADNNRPAAWTLLEITSVALPYTMLAGESLVLNFSPNAANYRHGNVVLTYDRL